MSNDPHSTIYAPPSLPRLPAPLDHVELVRRLGGTSQHEAWFARSSVVPWSNKLGVVVVFWSERPPFGSSGASGRVVVDLGPQLWEERWAFAVVTALPANLPGRYGHLTLLDFVGLGGMGEVWLAESPDYPNLRLAVKFLFDAHPTLREQFLREAEAGIALSHPQIARTYQLLDLSAEAACTWPALGLVMPFHEPSLAGVLSDLRDRGQKLPQALAIEWSRNLCCALDALHKTYQRVHRDLKPSNVLLRLTQDQGAHEGPESLAGSTALLSDLGTICPCGLAPAFGLGQDGYKAPELFRHEHDGRAHPSQDLYAFGLVLQNLAKVVEGQPDWLLGVATELTHTDPQRRPAAGPALFYKLSPDWRLQEEMIGAGWRPEAHPHFTGRGYIFEAFAQFAAACDQKKQGGAFVVEALGGVGKTALLTEWVSRDGPHPAFFFRRQEGRTSYSTMPLALFEVLCRRYDVQRFPPHREDQFADALADLLRHLAREKLGGARLLLFVDALDEADVPEKAVQMLPRALPAGVFAIVSSRPRIGDKDHLAPLRAAGACHFELAGDDARNLADLEAYLRVRLGPALVNGQARALAERLGGTFQLAIYFLEAIQDGDLSVADALRAAEGLAAYPVAQKVYAWYQLSWDRIISQVPGLAQQEDLTDFVSLLAAAQAPLGEKQILRILDWKGARRNWAQQLLKWLIVRRVEKANGYEEAYLQLRHQSVYDFLTSVEFEGPARDGLEEMHARLGRHYLKQAEGGWGAVEPYGAQFAVRHLLLARDRELLRRATECLTSLGYIEATLVGSRGGRR